MIIFNTLLAILFIGYIGNYYYKKFYRFKKPIIFELKNKDENTDYTKIRYSKKKVPLYIDTIVIGSGISGLTTASLLAKSGHKVVVFEQHYVAGGATHVFEDNGVEHETGLHYIGNIKKRFPILDLISDYKIEWCKLGEKEGNGIYDEIVINDKRYTLKSGEQNLIDYLCQEFPNEKMAIYKYFSLIKVVSNKDLYFMLKVFPFKIFSKYIQYFNPSFAKYCRMSAYDTIKELTSNEELIAVLCGQMGDYGQTPKQASFFIHASIVNHYLEGGYYPKGGPEVIANNIIKTIIKYDGCVFVGKGVKSIFISNNKAIGVIMDNGDCIYSHNVVSSIGVKNTFLKLMKDSNYNDKDLYLSYLDKCKPSDQHVYTFVKLDGTPQELNLSSRNYWVYPTNDFEKVFRDFHEDPFDAPMPMFIAFSCAKDSTWNERYPGKSNAIIITSVKKYFFDEWKDKNCGSRGNDYDQLKTLIGERSINEGLIKLFPNLKNKIDSYNVATPLTTQFYFDSYDGDSYGILMDKHRLLNDTILRPKTSVNNLYLTGQDICTLGVTGAMMSGVLTANVMLEYDNMIDIILGNNIITDLQKINKKNN